MEEKMFLTIKKCGISLQIGYGTSKKTPLEANAFDINNNRVWIKYSDTWYLIKGYDISIFDVARKIKENAYCKEQVLENILNIIE